MNITMQPVVSSQIQAIGFDAASNTLVVQFNNGSSYSYANVTQPVFDTIMAADSVGSTFHHLVRKNPQQFPYTKISG